MNTQLRPPAVPLVTCDPYFSIWSFDDVLHADATKHWTGAPHSLTALVKVDGKAYRIMGAEPRSLPAMKQCTLDVQPTQTIYTFEAGGVRLSLRFTTPLLPHDLDLLSRPASYVTWQVFSIDELEHEVFVYFEASSEIVVNTTEQEVIGSRFEIDSGLQVLRMGSSEQPILAKAGDDLRIDWGYLYLATPFVGESAGVVAAQGCTRDEFLQSNSLPAMDDQRQPRLVSDQTLVAAFVFEVGTVTLRPVSQYLVIGYDDLYSIEYFHRRLRPYWRRNGENAVNLLRRAVSEYDSLITKCDAFDQGLFYDLKEVGGEKYARIAALAYRQCLAAHKLVADVDGSPLLFSKENFSNGCTATVDVTYPTSPCFLLFNPELLEAALRPVLKYATMERWLHPFAPHDLGTYPLANGQVYGGGEESAEEQMPVEECGNMLIMTASLCLLAGCRDFALQHISLLRQWAQYLEQWGFDPEHQLCTDDFAGHLAHNANLSLKAIIALGAYAALCDRLGEGVEAEHYRKRAQGFTAQWLKAADDGDHYRLAFDKPGTWSQKYNLVWDIILDLNLFPQEVALKEIAFYRKQQNRYGLPLDSRKDWTKVDWIVWSATLAQSLEDFQALIEPVYLFVQESSCRVPLTDWYWTQDAKQVRGMQARPVVGGVFMKMLADSVVRERWQGAALR